MQHTVVTHHSLRGLSEADRTGMFRLRYQTFVTRLGWDVRTSQGNQEIDDFDRLARVHYIIAKSPEGGVDACWRLLPTQGPYMLRDVFPQLLHGQPAPAAANVWELSRFAVASDRVAREDAVAGMQLGFGPLSVAMMAELTRFARDEGIVRFVTVTTTAIERLLNKQGINLHRIGPPMRLGNTVAVACFIELDRVTLAAIDRGRSRSVS